MTSPIIVVYQTTLTVLRCMTGINDKWQTLDDSEPLIYIWITINVDSLIQWRPIGRMTRIAQLGQRCSKLALRFRLKSAQFVFHARTSSFTPFWIRIALFCNSYNIKLVFLIGKQQYFVQRKVYPYQITGIHSASCSQVIVSNGDRNAWRWC